MTSRAANAVVMGVLPRLRAANARPRYVLANLGTLRTMGDAPSAP